LVGISHTYLHNSHLALVDLGLRYFILFLHISSIFLDISSSLFISLSYSSLFHNIIISSYLLRILHISSAFGSKRRERGDGGHISRGNLSNIIFTPDVELRIFLRPTKAYVWSEFLKEACDWSGFSLQRSVIGQN